MSDRADPNSARPTTRIWWDGSEVHFIRWSERGLVFNWGDPRETAIHMPRGALMRLMQKGVIRIEGDAPDWIEVQRRSESQAAVHPLAYYNRPEPVEPQRAGRATSSAEPRLPKLTLDTNQTASTAPPPKAEPASPVSKLSIVARLIRKLGGGSERNPAQNRATTTG